MKEILQHLRQCGDPTCEASAVFDFSCRHGAEFPSCEQHAGQELSRAFEHDGNHGSVHVYQIGVASETYRELATYGLEH